MIDGIDGMSHSFKRISFSVVDETAEEVEARICRKSAESRTRRAKRVKFQRKCQRAIERSILNYGFVRWGIST